MGTAATDSELRATTRIGSVGYTRARTALFRALRVFAGVMLVSSTTSAHLGHGVASGERRIELDLDATTVALGYTLGLADGETKIRLERAHADGTENALLDGLTLELTRLVKFCSGSSEPDLVCRTLDRRELTSVAASGWDGETLLVEWRFRVPLRERLIKLEDAWQRDDITRTDVAIRPLSTRAPTRAGPNSPSSVELEFAFDDRLLAGAPRVVLVELPPKPASTLGRVVSAIVLCAVAALVTALALRRGRARGRGKT
jgi:hypothetical protein